MARPIGLHLRCNERLGDLTAKATRLNVQSFQFFLRRPDGTMLVPQKQELAEFDTLRQRCSHVYAHASYKINLADEHMHRHPALREEISVALKLNCTHMVIHPGANQNTQLGIDTIVNQLNYVTKKIKGITFVLENVAFGTPSIGGDLRELAQILHNIERPESVGICIDTAHAYAYGYDIASCSGCSDLINLLFKDISLDTLSLIHINDTPVSLGSKHDIHCRTGQGNIGQQALKRFALHKTLSEIPLLLELPAQEEIFEQEDLLLVQSWHNNQ